MKKIIPFKKDLLFKTKISEVTSISLEHNIKILEAEYVSGEFIVSGDYKITDASINKEQYLYNIPFDIDFDTKYDIDSIKIDIEDFYYEIINNEVIRVHIDVLFEGKELSIMEIEENKEIEDEQALDEIEVPPLPKQDIFTFEPVREEEEVRHKYNDEKEKDYHNEETLFKEEEEPPVAVSSNEEKIMSLFDSFDDNNETFTTYHVYIVRKEDNIESIMTKYNVTKDELALYNKIEELKIGDKIIIPALKNE